VLEDPLGIDRRLRDIAEVRSRFRRRLRRGTAAEHAFENVGRRASAELLQELESNGADDPLGPPLLRWAYLLHEEHALSEFDQALALAWHGERHTLEQPLSGSFTLGELRALALGDRRGARRERWAAFLGASERAGELGLRRWERRVEHAARLRYEGLDRLEGVSKELVEAAPGLLTATAEAFAALGVRELFELVELALAEDSAAAWPARLSVRSLVAWFEEQTWFRHVTLDLDELAPPLGGASFLRGLRELGRALRKAYVSPALPFSVAHDPFELEASTWGALFALLPLGDSFAVRQLGVARSRLSDHRRSLARVLLISLREAAFRALLREPSLQGSASARQAFVELGEAEFGFELPARAAGALFCPAPDCWQRFAAFGFALELDRHLTETHDEDWYRNPRAVAELRENAARAPETQVDAKRLARGLETLGRRLGG
jgi:hypothetical protein